MKINFYETILKNFILNSIENINSIKDIVNHTYFYFPTTYEDYFLENRLDLIKKNENYFMDNKLKHI